MAVANIEVQFERLDHFHDGTAEEDKSLGVVFEIPTVGIAKKLLCGDVSKKHVDSAEVRVRGKLAGHSLSTGPSAKPVFVSAGHMVSPRQARDIASRFLKHRIPEPTRRAHIVAESARRGTINK